MSDRNIPSNLVPVPRNVLEAMLEFLQWGKAKVDPYHLSGSIEELLASPVETSRDAEDAARYRFLRQPGNAIVYAQDRDAWGEGASGYVKWDTPEKLDAAVDRVRGALKAEAPREAFKANLQQAIATSVPQPIETAPQDGTSILGWNEDYGWRETESVTFQPGSPGHADGRTDRWWTWSEPVSNWAHTWKPTHWLPLPSPLKTT
jgi:hypothetical protein